MKNIVIFIIIVIAGGCLFLATHDIVAPQHKVDKAISNEQIFK